MIKKYLEHIDKRYVIATLDYPTRYFISQNNKLCFTTSIARCTKYASRDIAKFILEDFHTKVETLDTTLIILPLIISYELVDESDDGLQGTVLIQ